MNSEQAVQQIEGGNVSVTATEPEEMRLCQDALIDWCKRKIALMEREAKDAEQNFEHAIKSHWKAEPFKRMADMFAKRVVFYGKMMKALEAGYHIIPNMPLQLFAVRTDRKNPNRTIVKWESDVPNTESQALPESEGQWVNPAPLVRQVPDEDENQKPILKWQATSINEDIEFPIAMAKPQIMAATSRAQAIGVFDQLGILMEGSRGDPMIIAQIRDPRPKVYGRSKLVSFLVGWHIDTRTL